MWRRSLHEIWTDWVALVSGIASFVLMALAAVFSASVPSWVFWPAAYICLLVAAYRVWVREHKERLAEKISEAEARRAIGHRLTLFHEEGSRLKTDIMNSDDSTPVEECDEKKSAWIEKARSYLAEHVSPGKAGAFAGSLSISAATLLGMRSERTREGKTIIVLELNARLQRLLDIMREY